MKLKIEWIVYALISMIVAAFFGITLRMEITCMIPVSFVAMFCAYYENVKKDVTFNKSLLTGGIPALIGGLIIWFFFLIQINPT